MGTVIDTHAEAIGTERALLIAHELADVEKVREVGTNRGFWVEKFLAAVGLGGGYAWCAAFVFWCLVTAGVPKSMLPQRKDGFNPASVYGWYCWAVANGFAVSEKEAERGDLFFWLDKRGKTWQGHIGWFLRWLGADSYLKDFASIEGNTNDKGSREGDQVGRKERVVGNMRIHQLSGFISLRKIREAAKAGYRGVGA